MKTNNNKPNYLNFKIEDEDIGRIKSVFSFKFQLNPLIPLIIGAGSIVFMYDIFINHIQEYINGTRGELLFYFKIIYFILPFLLISVSLLWYFFRFREMSFIDILRIKESIKEKSDQLHINNSEQSENAKELDLLIDKKEFIEKHRKMVLWLSLILTILTILNILCLFIPESLHTYSFSNINVIDIIVLLQLCLWMVFSTIVILSFHLLNNSLTNTTHYLIKKVRKICIALFFIIVLINIVSAIPRLSDHSTENTQHFKSLQVLNTIDNLKKTVDKINSILVRLININSNEIYIKSIKSGLIGDDYSAYINNREYRLLYRNKIETFLDSPYYPPDSTSKKFINTVITPIDALNFALLQSEQGKLSDFSNNNYLKSTVEHLESIAPCIESNFYQVSMGDYRQDILALTYLNELLLSVQKIVKNTLLNLDSGLFKSTNEEFKEMSLHIFHAQMNLLLILLIVVFTFFLSNSYLSEESQKYFSGFLVQCRFLFILLIVLIYFQHRKVHPEQSVFSHPINKIVRVFEDDNSINLDKSTEKIIDTISRINVYHHLDEKSNFNSNKLDEVKEEIIRKIRSKTY